MYETIERIGNVVVKSIQAGEQNAPVYSDGAPEDRLYMKFKDDPNYGANREDARFSSWAEEYHLSPLRLNLLKWFPFDPKGTVLEVGAGCGALTGLLCQKSGKVTALEYSRQRALITAMRHSQRSNLEIIVGGLQDFVSDKKFDYVTVIGVFEYAGKFYGGDDPYGSFLAKLHGMLNPGGTLILAIENKIGLKYICGAQEDHTGRIFESIYGYPYSDEVRTFSKKELTDLLHGAGFMSLEWYYPLPDYKMPQAVLSEEVTPKGTDSVWTLYPAKNSSLGRKVVLAERWFGKTLAQAGLFGEFSNSFLVIAKKTKMPENLRCIRFWAANRRRKPEFKTTIQIRIDNRKKFVIRSPDNDKSIRFIREIAHRETFAKKFFEDKAEIVTGSFDGSSLYYDFIEFPSLEDLVADVIEKGDSNFGKSLVEEYIRFLQSLPSKECIPELFIQEFRLPLREITQPVKCLACATFNCVPRNIKVGPQNWYIIDNKWTFDYPLPIDYLAFRGILTLTVNLQSHIKIHSSKGQPVVLFRGYGKNREYIPLSWVEILQASEIPLDKLVRWESRFRNKINIGQRHFRLRLNKNPKVLTHVDLCEISSSFGKLHRLSHPLSNMAKLLRRILLII